MTSKYDNGDFDKALELNEKIRVKHPEHPGKFLTTNLCTKLKITLLFSLLIETNAMKALIIFSLKRKTEAFVIINAQLK